MLCLLTSTATCTPPCEHGGRCVRPNVCACRPTYIGPHCGLRSAVTAGIWVAMGEIDTKGSGRRVVCPLSQTGGAVSRHVSTAVSVSSVAVVVQQDFWASPASKLLNPNVAHDVQTVVPVSMVTRASVRRALAAIVASKGSSNVSYTPRPSESATGGSVHHLTIDVTSFD
ncbi:hypothetical protein C0Q70_18831 [Pomacea canaliculata]|uniref:EGF-like domain-containing protein n=1 Tax=Pomacea canaliculata TaxID=400727 RepID=A0A2T7NHM0_POMCA|nr:hypothetical protein C0Q70_18831 [Pomacea canaliculata]